MRDLPSFPDERLIIGSATSDDAGVFLLDDERALVQTVDFFTPIVDDPFTYGQIAATNSLSDVYAMGGRPITAMNLLGLPEAVSLDMANEILKGGAEKVKEARCALAGGHSIKCPEPIYGLSVTGLVHPKKVISNAGAKVGDVLVLTKPLGNGIIATAVKKQICPPGLDEVAVAAMVRLNTPGAVLAERGLTVAGTDITGFALLGHLGSLCRSSGVTAEISAAAIPMLGPAVADLIASGCVPGGTKANLKYASEFTDFGPATDVQKILLADAQTSGGLLLCIPPAKLNEAMDLLAREQVLCQAIVGKITAPNADREDPVRIRVV